MIHHDNEKSHTYERHQAARYDSGDDADIARSPRQFDHRPANGCSSGLDGLSVILLHEIKQPLTASMNLLEAAIRQAEHNPSADQNQLIEMMRSANDQLVRAVDLLRKLKQNGSNGQADLQRCEFNDVIQNALDVVRERSNFNTVHVNLALAERPVCIHAHEMKLTQAIVNVLQNAIDAGQSENKHPPAVTVRLTVNSTVATVRVHNDGPLLTDHALDRLFDPFFTTKSQGTGLGLAISRRVFEQHGGSVRLFNAEGGGVTCEMTLPIAKENGDV